MLIYNNVEEGDIYMETLMIKKLLKVLKSNKDTKIYNYTVPDLWNCFNYDETKFTKTQSNELMVNPYDFFISVIKDYIMPNIKDGVSYKTSLSKATNKKTPKKNYRGGDWIKQSIVYSTMIRTSAAWDNDRSGLLEKENIYKMPETGSFVRMLAMLPLLKKNGS